MNLSAVVLHNVSPDMFFGYSYKSKLYHAHEFQIVADDIERASELAFMLANVDDASHLVSLRPDLSLYSRQVTEYRARSNRSLSVGDVVLFRDLDAKSDEFVAAMVVEQIGWRAIKPDTVSFADGTNTTPTSVSRQAHERFFEERARSKESPE